MCLIKKYNMDLKRYFLTGYCVATLRKPGTPLVDLCLFSGEGKPTLIGGYAITPHDAIRLANELILNANRAKETTPEQKKNIAEMYLISAYNLLKDSDKEAAEKLKSSMGIKEIKPKEEDLGYVG
ncbi:MAG: hypothetical protein ABIG84_06700 [archaeon]